MKPLRDWWQGPDDSLPDVTLVTEAAPQLANVRVVLLLEHQRQRPAVRPVLVVVEAHLSTRSAELAVEESSMTSVDF